MNLYTHNGKVERGQTRKKWKDKYLKLIYQNSNNEISSYIVICIAVLRKC
jgi:hypothetical protein